MNVVMVGIDDNRTDILKEISNECKIILYTDIKKYHRGFTSFDYVPYVHISDLSQYSYDYVVISYSKTSDIEATLLEFKEYSLDDQKIVEYQLFKETLCIDQVKAFSNTNQKFDIFLFGMSHSQCSIQPQYFTQKLYKFASPSMDMFCQEKVLEQLITQFPESVSNAKQFVFEFPYYIFNFDLSRFRKFVLNRLYYFYTFSDYHHFGERREEESLVEHFENYVTVFAKKEKAAFFSLNKDVPNKEVLGLVGYIKKLYHEVLRIKEILTFKDNVWFKDYRSTQEENVALWKKVLEHIKQYAPNAEIIVLVCPFDPLFRHLYKKQINRMKQQFYECIGEVKIIDCFSYNEHYEYADHCHLKTDSGMRFTQFIRKQLGD